MNVLRQIHEVIKQSDQVIKSVSRACWLGGAPGARGKPLPHTALWEVKIFPAVHSWDDGGCF